MDIDFSKQRKKPVVNKDFVRQYVSDIDVFRYYYRPDLKARILYPSPFRSEEKPSFNIFHGRYCLMFKDFGSGQSGDCFRFVAVLHNITDAEAIRKVAKDFGIIDEEGYLEYSDYAPAQTTRFEEEHKTEFKIYKREFTYNDETFWRQFGIFKQTLDMYGVFPVEQVYSNTGRGFKLTACYSKNKPVYCYPLENGYKIYCPYHEIKWRFNGDATSIEGFKQLKESDVVFWTKSLKDVMVFREFGYEAFSLAGERTIHPEENELVQWLLSRYKRVLVWFDNDATGIESMKRLNNLYNLETYHIPKQFISKDISDFVRDHGLGRAKFLIKELL